MADNKDNEKCETNKKMMKKYRKSLTKTSEAAANIVNNIVGVSEVNDLMKTVSGDNNYKVSPEASKVLEQHHSAQKEGEVEFLAEYFKMHLGLEDKINDPFGDGDQSMMVGFEAMKLRTQWASGFDYNPESNYPQLSEWCKACFFADLDKVQRYISGIVSDDDRLKLLERRESMIRFCAIFHVICGARVNPSQKHIEIAKMVVNTGCNINARDVAGYTPLHHCLTQYGNETTLQIAKILVDHGADVNATNRFGGTPLIEPCMSFNYEFIEFLVCNGSDPSIKDNDGISCQIIGSRNPRICSLFSKGYRAMAKASKKNNEEALEEGALCNYCHKSGKLSKCSGCMVVKYCSRACQTYDWKDHKPHCKTLCENKKAAGNLVYVRPVLNPYGEKIMMYNEKSKSVDITEKGKHANKKIQNDEKAMKVKIQV